jgi:hypothetical protein
MLIAAAGVWFGGVVDELIQRITEINMLLPFLPILIMVGTFMSRSLWTILVWIILLSIFGGAIKGYRAVLDPDKLGLGFIAYIAVGLSEHTKRAQTAFEQAIQAAPEVRECHNITGSVEYLLRVEAPDLRAYKRFHTDTLGSLPQVATITTYVVMGSPKDERA